jgi:hypothetical protein
MPATRLADLTNGGFWQYTTYPGNHTGSSADNTATGYKYLAFTQAGSSLTMDAGCGGTDADVPGAIVRLYTTTKTSGRASGTLAYRYDGTYHQDPVTGDVFLLRLPTGQQLDAPAKILPGTWYQGVEIHSSFVVNGTVIAEYTLTVEGPETVDTLLGRKPTWRTRIQTHWLKPKGKEHELTSEQSFEPASGGYLQASSRDATMVLNDLTLVAILDDEKISSYSVNP